MKVEHRNNRGLLNNEDMKNVKSNEFMDNASLETNSPTVEHSERQSVSLRVSKQQGAKGLHSCNICWVPCLCQALMNGQIQRSLHATQGGR